MPSSGKIVVIGSSNTDMVVKSRKLPAPGETVIGETFLMNPGGKGANQAVAAARLGGKVIMAARIGNDVFGKQAVSQFENENMDTAYITVDEELPSGVALINVDANGENCISVAPGSNSKLSPEHLEQLLETVSGQDLALLQLEIPVETAVFAIRKCFEKKCRVILNPAPASPLPENLFPCLYLITPNETEAALLTGIPVTDIQSAAEAAQQLRAKGVANVIITLGSKGAFLLTDSYSGLIAAPQVTAVDTTAAGDCFNGAVAVALAEQMPLEKAVAFAGKAAALCVTKLGAQSSMPYRSEMPA
ncbi:ribokinase [Dyadobacter sediminis]|uniref:Ribokinase n=2 Tax=Dyadobacter sediminis TaxID=1493691 RepID=A0A5R9KCG2_9BACT|nr:ribokinase [Dyadobacter sediminis]